MPSDIKNVKLSFAVKKIGNVLPLLMTAHGFVDHVKHHVIDFTQADQSTLENALKSEQRVCGKFKSSQMNESFLKMAAASLLIAASASTISCTKEKVEANPTTISHRFILEQETEIMGDVELTGIIFDLRDSTIIKLDTLDLRK